MRTPRHDAAARSYLPGVVGAVGEGRVGFGGDDDWEVDGAAVAFGEVGGLGADLPVLAAVHVFDDVNGDGLGFLVGEGYFKAFVGGVAVLVDLEVGLALFGV